MLLQLNSQLYNNYINSLIKRANEEVLEKLQKLFLNSYRNKCQLIILY